jgi:hypothetical protein
VNEIRSLFRVVRLKTPPPDDVARQVLLVPAGSTDAEVLAWAGQCLDEASLAELREVLERERR